MTAGVLPEDFVVRLTSSTSLPHTPVKSRGVGKAGYGGRTRSPKLEFRPPRPLMTDTPKRVTVTTVGHRVGDRDGTAKSGLQNLFIYGQNTVTCRVLNE